MLLEESGNFICLESGDPEYMLVSICYSGCDMCASVSSYLLLTVLWCVTDLTGQPSRHTQRG